MVVLGSDVVRSRPERGRIVAKTSASAVLPVPVAQAEYQMILLYTRLVTHDWYRLSNQMGEQVQYWEPLVAELDRPISFSVEDLDR